MVFRKELGFDLGTSTMYVTQKDKGIILDEPEIIAINLDNRNVVAVGNEAYEMYERTPEPISINNPVKYGVVADFDNMLKLLEYQMIKLKIDRNKLIKHTAVISAPYDISDVERRALYDLFLRMGGKFGRLYLIEKPAAAALGCGIDILDARGNMLVDIGGGTTEVSVVSLGGIVISKLIKIGGEKFDSNIQNYIKKVYNLNIGIKTAEKIKKLIGSVYDEGTLDYLEITGTDILSGLPKKMKISSEDIYQAIKDDVNIIVDTIRLVLEKTPPELSADILSTGIYLVGGGSQIKNLDKLITEETDLKVNLIGMPKVCVANGINIVLKNIGKYKYILSQPRN